MDSELSSRSAHRISSIDIMQGILMVIMALDHTRDYFHVSAFLFDPTDLTKTSPAIFFTRWVTHFCAPGFVFLSGTSIYLNLQRKSKTELSKFLVTRGLWLILVDLVVMRFALLFNFYYDVTIFGIIGVIGACMMLMAALIYVQLKYLLIIAVLIITVYPLVSLPVFTSVGFIQIMPGYGLVISYPILPWLAIMMGGYCLGIFYSTKNEAAQRSKSFLICGFMLIGVFILLRSLNIYGDSPWVKQETLLYTILSFFNITKYPVSLLFALFTTGTVLVGVAVIERTRFLFSDMWMVFGRVPFFYFIVHFFLIHMVALLVSIIRAGRPFNEVDFHFDKSFGGIVPGEGISLLWVCVIWIAVVVAMYPLCRAYDRYKRSHTHAWLSYL